MYQQKCNITTLESLFTEKIRKEREKKISAGVYMHEQNLQYVQGPYITIPLPLLNFGTQNHSSKSNKQ